MRPIKRKQLSEKVAERLNLSAETVDEIIQCYYSAIQKKLSGLVGSQISLDGLGTFYIKRSKLEEKLRIYKLALKKYEDIKQPTLREYTSLMSLRKDVDSYQRMLDELTTNDERKAQKEEEKKLYKTTKHESDKNMEREG